MAGISVEPYWELTFDAEGDADPGERDALVRGVAERDVTDLVVFAHGWNNDRSMATRLYDRFFAPFPGVLADAGAPARLGYAGVIWPSMRFTDEPVPDFPARDAVPPGDGPRLEPATLRALAAVFPGSEALLDRLAELLEQRSEDPSRLEEFAALVRRLVLPRQAGTAAGADASAEDLDPDAGERAEPDMFADEPARVCGRFADALATAEPAGAETAAARAEFFGDLRKRLWSGALELLRQGSYWEMKRRAGVVGRAGLGPVLELLAGDRAGPRVHLVGHSFGARLMAFALGALPERTESVRSLTMLQGAFSHYAFAPRLPFDNGRGGALKGLHERVRGPVVCCHSRHDQALSLLYPLASRVSGDSASAFGLDDARWGAMGHDGVQAVEGTGTLQLARALQGPLPESGCVNVDVAAVVRRGGPPTGAHSDICHGELARLVLLAGRIVR
ncbi:serine-threonine protein kinase [Streptomyces sp. NPDC053048]|uniref:serine-threonine protein kinase n=1 Tax=Streptomyces sp. NPDC053048 TaxID=3365694 RepID=UPI0037CE1887